MNNKSQVMQKKEFFFRGPCRRIVEALRHGINWLYIQCSKHIVIKSSVSSICRQYYFEHKKPLVRNAEFNASFHSSDAVQFLPWIYQALSWIDMEVSCLESFLRVLFLSWWEISFFFTHFHFSHSKSTCKVNFVPSWLHYWQKSRRNKFSLSSLRR